MAKLIVRSKSHQKLRPPRKDSKDVHHVSESRQPDSGRTVRNNMTDSTVKASYLGSDTIRPKTANAAMDRKKNLMATGSPISVMSGTETFNFPTPVRSPRPLLSRYATQSPALRSGEFRSDTPESIGIALGSPSHLAHFQSPLARSPIQGHLFAPSQDILTPISTPGPSQLSQEMKPEKPEIAPAEKPKLSRWRSLGGLFARKPSALGQQPKENSQPRTPISAGLILKDYHTWEHQSPSKVVAISSPQLRSKHSKGRVGIGRSQTAPTARRTGGSPQSLPKDNFIDVQIPSVEMERYSVMFNDILPGESSSLLARRQANAERSKPFPGNSLKALDILSTPKRRNTTPEPSPSYRLLVFPPEKVQQSPRPHISLLHRPRPLRRSNTAPGALSPGLQEKRSRVPQLSPMSEGEEPAVEVEEMDRQGLTPTPSEPSTPTTPADGQSVHSYNPFHDRSSVSWDKELHEPSWEMITIGKLAEPGDRFSGAQVRVQGADDSPIDGSHQPSHGWHPLHMNKSHEEPQVQIARSMSVTKAQRVRPVLKPRVTLVNDAKLGERLVERKPLTPTLVELVEVPGRQRKSVRVLIEDA